MSKKQLYDDVIDVTKLTNYALKMVIDEMLFASNDALTEIIEDGESDQDANPNRNGWICYAIFVSICFDSIFTRNLTAAY